LWLRGSATHIHNMPGRKTPTPKPPASREHVDATAQRRFEKADAQIAEIKEKGVQDRRRKEVKMPVRDGLKEKL
jgi:hypothetical protein